MSENRRPAWREEFSVFGADERYVNRRQFAKFLVLTSAGMFAGNLWLLVKAKFGRAVTRAFPRAAVARASDVPVGGATLFRYPTADDPCILVRTAEDAFAAYSQKCTHLSCAVYWSPENGRLECPCHEGYFSIADGRVLQGPPIRPLPRIRLERDGESLVAVGVDESPEERGEGGA